MARTRLTQRQVRGVTNLTPEDALQWARLMAGLIFAFAGIVHLSYAPTHFDHRHDMGLFFVVVGASQLFASWYLICRAPSLVVAGLSALGAAGVIVIYLVSRTIGMPIGPTPNVAESVGLLDMLVTLLEAVAVGLLAVTVIADLTVKSSAVARKPRYGLYMVGAGIGLQFLGLNLDSLLLESGSTAGNGAILNPTLLVSLGIALAVAGLFRELLDLDTAGSPAARFFARPGLGSFAFTTLGGFMAAVALTTGGLGGAGSHDDSDHPHAANGGELHATATEDELANDSVFIALKQTLQEKGTEAAIARLSQLAASDASVLGRGHPLIHALGRFSFTHYGSASQAFNHCTADFASGCYHGVLEEYLKTRPKLEAKDIVSLCDGSIDTSQSVFVKFQCLHGLGHGLTLLYQHDIFKSLQYCDYLSTDWDRQSCYGGVFMENIVFASEPHHDGEHKTFLKADDLLYPCNSIASKYQYQCYNLQTSAILRFNGQNYASAAKECDKAPDQYISICYASLGRDISGSTLRNPARSIEYCLQGTQKHWGDCLAGVAKDFVNTDYKADSGLALCQQAPDSTKGSCYSAIGEMLLSLYNDPNRRAQECDRAEPSYIAACRTAARL